MSKIINGLRDIKDTRDANGSTSIINKTVSKSQTPAFNKKDSFFNKIILLFVLFSAGMNLWVFLVIKNLSSERENAVSSLNRIEKLLSENSHQVDSVGTEVKRINSNLEAINTRIEIETKKIARLQKDSDAKEFAVNNLKKAKDTLFDRINQLELNLVNLKSQDSSDFTRKP